MKRQPVIILFSCFLLSILLIAVLYSLSNSMIHKRNTFLRVFPPHPVNEDTVLDVKYNSYYLAGATQNTIYYGNFTGPLHLLTSSISLSDTQHIRLRIRDFEKFKFRAIQVKVDSPYFFVMDGLLPGFFRGNTHDWFAEQLISNSVFFSAAAPISPTAFAIRSSNQLTKEDILGKQTTNGAQFTPDLIQKQVDGVFCIDGMLHFDRELQILVYVYFYRNQYVVMDTTLSLLYRGNTIDTVSRAQVKVDSIISKNSYKYTMSAPPLLVNRKSSVYKNWLFVNSDLLAKNENIDAFNQGSVIDVYDLIANEYQFSFYVPNYNENKMREFQIYNNKLFALFDHYVVSYDLNAKYFKDFNTLVSK